MHARRRDELEARIATLEAEYEELLGTSWSLYHGLSYSPIPHREDNTR